MSFSLVNAAAEAPHRPVLIVAASEGAPAQLWTFSQLAFALRRCAAALAEHDVGLGTRVALVGDRRPETLIALYALMELGAPAVMLHPRLTLGERERIVSDSRPVLMLDEESDLLAISGNAPEPPAADVPDEACLAVLYTSGTNGRPKGALLSRGAFRAAAEASAARLGWRRDDRWLLAMPLAHVGGLSIVTRCLLARRCVVLDPAEAFDPERTAEVVESCRVTLVSLVPTMLARLLRLEPAWRPPEHLRAILLGGAGAPAALLEEAADRGWPVLTTYGCTEACSQIATQRPGTVNRGQLGSGPPLDGLEVRIRPFGDDAGTGLVEVRGPSLFEGYLGETEIDSVEPNPRGHLKGPGPGGWFRPGDLGRFDGEGNLHILGRRSDLIVTGGENVYPAEVEAALEEHPAVAAACVFGVEDPTWGQLVAAALVPGSASRPENRQLAAFFSEHLAGHKRPRHIAWIADLALNPNGKPDRRETARQAGPHLTPLA